MSNLVYVLKSPAFYRCPGNRTSEDVKDATKYATLSAAWNKAQALNVKRSLLNQLSVVPIKEEK